MKGKVFSVITLVILLSSLIMVSMKTENLTQAAPLISKTIFVTSTADSGAGTLRQILANAQNGDKILFDTSVFPPASPVTIYLSSPLPAITKDNLTIDASDVGVIIDGSAAGSGITPGLSIQANHVAVRGLQIVNFAGCGIEIYGHENVIGGDRSVGIGPLGQGNLLSGSKNHSGIGLFNTGAYSNTIQGNLIGVRADGLSPWGNAGDGVHINGGHHNLILGNIIGGNSSGIQGCCTSDTSHNSIRGNWIGVGIDGSTPITNTLAGVWFHDGASYNTVGSDNLIAYNQTGVLMHTPASLGNTITQNSIFSNAYGISLEDGSNGGLAAPVVTAFDLASGMIMGRACPGCTVEVFSDLGNQGGIFEGSMQANAAGVFVFAKDESFTGPHLTTTATDNTGNTSSFSFPTSGSGAETIIQAGNGNYISTILTKQSFELSENHISGHTANPHDSGMDYDAFKVYQEAEVFAQGIKGMHIYLNEGEEPIDWTRSDYTIEAIDDAWIDLLGENDVYVVFGLSFWDKDNHPTGWPPVPSRFTTEEEIQRYLDYVRYIVTHFRGRIAYYELWNEPDNMGTSFQFIEPEAYVELIRRTVPVIKEADPDAKVVVGAVSYLMNPYCQAYINTIIKSDVLPLVDVISFHPMFGTSPEHEEHREYYYAYPQIVRDFQRNAYANGFTGIFRADEIYWCSPGYGCGHTGFPMHTEFTVPKYLARGTITNLGLGLVAGAGTSPHVPRAFTVIRNLSTIFSGVEVTQFPVEISTTIINVVSYTFSLPQDTYLLALWNDGVAADEDLGVGATVKIPGFAGYLATGLDPLHSLQQPLITRDEGNALVIENLMLKDYPILIRLAPQ
ncbi:MAG: hypothetical protein GX577_16450 [Leptolinea sp.]|nr:hypothetical protein [Leptolinea sp.]